jgi:hypothetical protein
VKLLREPELHRLVYLRCHDGELCRLCLTGPRKAADLVTVPDAVAHQMIDKYLTVTTVPLLKAPELSEEERRAAATGPFVSFEEVIADHMGVSVEEATVWIQQKGEESKARWAELERRFNPYRLDDLDYSDGVFTVGLNRPDDQSRTVRLTAADMAQVVDSYLAQWGKWTMAIIARCMEMTLRQTAEWLKEQDGDDRAASIQRVRIQLRDLASPKQ